MNRASRAAQRSCLAAVLLLGAGIAGCAKKGPPETPAEIVAVRAAAVPATPDDAAWQAAPAHVAPLLLQDMVEPRLQAASTPWVRVQAITDGERVAFRLAWTDSTRDDRVVTSRFADACAVQLPQAAGRNLPAPQMGEAGVPVEMTYWSASWQAEIDGRPDSIRAFYPNASVDHYPFEAPTLESGGAAQREMARRYAPARVLAERGRHPPDRPVQDLLAEGPGTITPAGETRSMGTGRWSAHAWSVVLVRPLPQAWRGAPRTHAAVAIWNGDRDEAGARKMRSVWIPLILGGGS